MNTNDNNITFFLGAGFSKAAGAPMQSELLSKVLNYGGDHYNNPVTDYKKRIISFLEDGFHLSREQMNQFNLEDFFTPIDKCISENASFRGYSLEYIRQIRNELSILIAIIIDWELINSDYNKDYINLLIDYVANRRKSRSGIDISIITTNWDILIDRRIYQRYGNGLIRKCINYGTNVSILNKPNNDGVRIENGPIKLLKIHGSLNWLKCPSCNRLYVNLESKIGIPEYNLRNDCDSCRKVYRIPEEAEMGLKLEPQIIYPTFLKDFSSVHFKRIWEYAADEISESRKMIFIGYSFQQADFEIRQLLARKVPDNCEIICVLNGREPSRNPKTFWATPQARYESFFGGRNIKFLYCGAREFITNHLNEL